MREKAFPVLPFTLFLLSLLAACQDAGQAPPLAAAESPFVEPTFSVVEDDSVEVENNVDQDDDILPISVELWHPFSGLVAEQLEKLAQEYSQLMNGDVTIYASAHADQEVLYTDILNAIEGERDLPEIIIAPSSDIQILYDFGEVLVLDTLEQGDAASAESIHIFPAFWNIDITDDHRIGVPYYQSGNFIFYNQSWANEIGFESYPKTIDEFTNQVCTAYQENRFDDEDTNDGTGGYFYPQGSSPFLAWMSGFGGGAFYNTRDDLILTGGENIRSLVYLNDLFADDCAWWTAKEDNPFRYFSERYTLAYSGNGEDIFAQHSVFDESKIEDNWILIPYPSIDQRPILFFQNLSFALMKDVPETSVDALLDFITWMLKPENHAEMVYVSGVFPLGADEIGKIDQDWPLYDIWNETLQYIPYLQPFPRSSNWYITDKVLSDVGWQLIQYNIGEASVPDILSAAEVIVNTWE